MNNVEATENNKGIHRYSNCLNEYLDTYQTIARRFFNFQFSLGYKFMNIMPCMLTTPESLEEHQ